MKRMLMVGLLLMVGCESETYTDPDIWVDVSPVYVGMRSTDTSLDPIHFDLQLFNRGEKALQIDAVTLIGDQNCSFTIEGPDKDLLAKGEAAFVRGWYKPTVVGDDFVALIVDSNSVLNNPFIIPICGRGVAPGTTDAGDPPTCVEPPASQPDCQQ